MRPNWFIGLPAHLSPAVEALIPAPPPRVRVFLPEDRHVTLAFLGGCEAQAAHRAFESLQGASPELDTAALGPTRALGNPRRPSALCVLLDQGNDVLIDFMHEHRARLLHLADARPDHRPPLPHLTLARVQRRASAAQHHRALSWLDALALAGQPVELGPPALYTWSRDRRQRLFQVVVGGHPRTED